ncbi:carbohydrate ABC transporter permease [Ruminococcaceae bacterium OttesenSCG-928-L11]|nr:carbohydrate ABC transporter permease [Ruminococcaceae bacterium OttesenSCG-928-L11]
MTEARRGANPNRIKPTRGDRVYDVINTVLLVVLGLLVLYPLYFVLIASISNPDAVNSGKIIFYPMGVTFEGYQKLFEDSRIWIGYRNTILYTVVGTTLNVSITLLAAYPLSRTDLDGRKYITFFFLFTMFFNGGLIPTFLVVQSLGLYNTPWVLVLLGAVSVYNMLIARSFFENSIPQDLHEAAAIDGCGNIGFFFRIVLPLSKALIGVMVIYYGVTHWNQYFNALIYVSKREYQPLQMVLREILIQNSATQMAFDESMMEELLRRERYAELIKYGVIVVASLPILCVYPFVQKYFEKGVMIGAVKG